MYRVLEMQRLMILKIYTTHSKTRRRKRTDTRVKELEQRVAEMSFLLEHGRSSSTPSSVEKEDDIVDTHGNNDDVGGVYSFSNSRMSPGTSTKDDPWVGRGTNLGLAHNGPLSSNQRWEQATEASDPLSLSPDVIDRGILSISKATELYQDYVDALLPQYPAIPLSCSVTELRSKKPILFLAVLAASSGASDPSLNNRLNQEVQQVYATKVSIQGLKSLELVQALLVSILWTYPPNRFEDLKFHQQIHMAATMALDLGLAKKPKGTSIGQQPSKVIYAGQHPDSAEDRGSPSVTTRFPVGQPLDVSDEAETANHVMAPKEHLPDSGSLESRRTLLGCYLFCASVSMSLRLPNFLRWSSWMADCSEVLRTSPDAEPTDKRFVAWVQLQRIVEECGTNFALDSPDDTVSLADERAQLMLQNYEKQLEAWRQQAISNGSIMNCNCSQCWFARSDANSHLAFLEITYHANNIYLHEIALHPDHDAEDFKPPFSVAVNTSMSHPAAGTLTPPYVNAIIRCISSSNALLETFLGMRYVESEALEPSSRKCHLVGEHDVGAKALHRSPVLSNYPRFTRRFTDVAILCSVQQIRVTPTLVYVRTVYAVVILIKLASSASATELGKVLKPEDIKVALYLEKLLIHLKAVATLDNHNTHTLGAKFLQILTKVKVWFQKQGKPDRPAKEETRTASGFETSTSMETRPENPSQYTDKFNFPSNFGKAPTTDTTAWFNQPQPSNENFDSNYSMQPSWNDVAFDFPMDLDPSLITHLIQADQTENNQGGETLNMKGFNQMDYLHNMPDFGSWPAQ